MHWFTISCWQWHTDCSTRDLVVPFDVSTFLALPHAQHEWLKLAIKQLQWAPVPKVSCLSKRIHVLNLVPDLQGGPFSAWLVLVAAVCRGHSFLHEPQGFHDITFLVDLATQDNDHQWKFLMREDTQDHAGDVFNRSHRVHVWLQLRQRPHLQFQIPWCVEFWVLVRVPTGLSSIIPPFEDSPSSTAAFSRCRCCSADARDNVLVSFTRSCKVAKTRSGSGPSPILISGCCSLILLRMRVALDRLLCPSIRLACSVDL